MRAVLVAAILCACARVSSSRDLDVRPEGNDDSGRWFLISCPHRGTTCTQTAGLICPDGYLVVNADGYQVAASLAGLPEVRNGQLRIRCAPSFILEGR
jgi:hypothetical protein